MKDNLRKLPGFENIDYTQVNSPTIFSRSGRCLGCKSYVFSKTGFLDFLNHDNVYICQWEERDPDIFFVRGVIDVELLSNVVQNIKISNMKFREIDFIPYKDVDFRLNTETLQDLKIYGRDEIVRQIGEHIVQAFEKSQSLVDATN